MTRISWRDFALIAATALVLMAPALVHGAPGIDSAAFNYVWTRQFAEGLASGDIYPRWLPGSFEGLGSPTFYYYPPLAFYLSGALEVVGLETTHAIAAAGLVLLLASGGAMYAWLRRKTGYAVLGACLYMAAPYHIADFYVRAALAEFAGFVWLPLIALALESQPKRWAAPLLCLAFAGLLVSHLPTAVLATLFLIAPMVALRIYRERTLAFAATSLVAGVAALGLAAIYLVPALGLQSHLSTSILWGPLYQPAAWSVLNPGPGIPAGVLYTFASLAAGAALLAVSAGLGFWSILAVAVAVASLGLPPGLWALPLLTQVQFPWRSLVIVEFAAITAFMTSPKRLVVAVAAGALMLPGAFKLAEAAQQAFANPYPADIDSALPDAPEYLPPSFHAPGVLNYETRPDLSRLAGPLVRGAAVDIKVGRDGSIGFQATRSGPVVIRRAAYPSWQVTLNGRAVELDRGPLIAFQARPGHYEVRRIRLPQELVGGWISLLSALGFASFLGWTLRRRAPPDLGAT